jgi:hypothetical protein
MADPERSNMHRLSKEGTLIDVSAWLAPLLDLEGHLDDPTPPDPLAEPSRSERERLRLDVLDATRSKQEAHYIAAGGRLPWPKA